MMLLLRFLLLFSFLLSVLVRIGGIAVSEKVETFGSLREQGTTTSRMRDAMTLFLMAFQILGVPVSVSCANLGVRYLYHGKSSIY